MNSMQKTLKDMVSVLLAQKEELTEQMIDDGIHDVSGMPMFAVLSPEEIKAVASEL